MVGKNINVKSNIINSKVQRSILSLITFFFVNLTSIKLSKHSLLFKFPPLTIAGRTGHNNIVQELGGYSWRYIITKFINLSGSGRMFRFIKDRSDHGNVQ